MLVTHGDFVLSGLNFWLGSVDVSLDPDPFCISPDYKVFKLTDNVDPRFFRQLIRTAHFRHILEAVAVERASVVRKNFDRETFLQSEVPLPGPDRQDRISQALEAAEREVAIEIARLDALSRQKRGLMQKLLTGEWRVPLRDGEVDDLAERAATGEAA
jgi:type I restriction enzyme, S subunit